MKNKRNINKKKYKDNYDINIKNYYNDNNYNNDNNNNNNNNNNKINKKTSDASDHVYGKFIKQDVWKERTKRNADHVSRTKGDRGPQGFRGLKGEKGDPGDCGCLSPATPTPTIQPRLNNCILKTVGLPLYLGHFDQKEGSLMRDLSDVSTRKFSYWVTKGTSGNSILFFQNFESFQRGQITETIILPDEFQGTEHVIHNKSFIYHAKNTENLHKLNLETKKVEAIALFPDSIHSGSQSLFPLGHSFFDISIDLNGLWVVYQFKEAHLFLKISKLNLDTLDTERTWMVDVFEKPFQNLFIICGKLYFLKETNQLTTSINFIFDLYTEQWFLGNYSFKNPYTSNSMVSFDWRERNILSWDGGNVLTTPVLL